MIHANPQRTQFENKWDDWVSSRPTVWLTESCMTTPAFNIWTNTRHLRDLCVHSQTASNRHGKTTTRKLKFKFKKEEEEEDEEEEKEKAKHIFDREKDGSDADAVLPLPRYAINSRW